MKKSKTDPGNQSMGRRKLELGVECSGASHTSKDCPVLLALENTLNAVDHIGKMETTFLRFVDNGGDDEAKAQLHSRARELDATFWRLGLSFCEWVNERFISSGKCCHCSETFKRCFEKSLADAKANLDQSGDPQHGV